MSLEALILNKKVYCFGSSEWFNITDQIKNISQLDKIFENDNKNFNLSVYQKKYIASHPWIRTLYNIRTRCEHKSHKGFKNYGGKGIKCLLSVNDIKSLWLFYGADDMVNPSIDRIDSNGNYAVSNCRFIELGVNKGRRNKEKTHCSRGHEFNDKNTYYYNGKRRGIPTTDI